MYEHEPGRVPSQSPLLLVNMALGTSTTPQLTSLKGFSSEKWNNVEMTPRKVATYNCEAPLTDTAFSPWRQISTLLGTSHPHMYTSQKSSCNMALAKEMSAGD